MECSDEVYLHEWDTIIEFKNNMKKRILC